MAPGSSETREGFLRDWIMANARNFRTGPEVMEEGNKLYDLIQGVEPEAVTEQDFGTVAAAEPGGPPKPPERKPTAISPRGSSVTIPLPPMELDPDIRARANIPPDMPGGFTEAELSELQRNDPDQFKLLLEYLEGR